MKKTRIEKAAETRCKIVEEAAKILSTEGVDGLTSGKLASRLELSKGTLFHHFGGMEDIHLAVLDFIILSMTTEVETTEFANVSDFIEAVVSAAYGEHDQYRGVYAALLHYIGHAEHNEAYRFKLKAMFEMMMASWEEILRVNLGRDISQQKLEKAIRIIDMHFAGLITHDLIFKDPLKYKALTKDFLELMVSYLE